jgi:hypothetical protein
LVSSCGHAQPLPGAPRSGRKAKAVFCLPTSAF